MISYQSLLLSTTVLNDKLLHYLKHLYHHYHYQYYDYGSGKSSTYKDYYDYGSGKPPFKGHDYHNPHYKLLHYLKHYYHYYDYQYYDYGSGSGKSPTNKDYYDYGSGKPPTKGHEYQHLYYIIHQYLNHRYHYYDSHPPPHDNKHAYYDYHYSYPPYNIIKYLKKKTYHCKYHQSTRGASGLSSGQPPFSGSGLSPPLPPTKAKDHHYPPHHLPPYKFLYLFYKYYNKKHKSVQSNAFFSDGKMTEFNYCCSGKSTNQSYEIDGKQCIPCEYIILYIHTLLANT